MNDIIIDLVEDGQSQGIEQISSIQSVYTYYFRPALLFRI